MEKKSKIIFRQEAKESIRDIAFYIELCGYPETAEKYTQRLLSFGESLLVFPDKYPICRFPKLAKRNLHCAVFEQNYIFIYKVIHDQVLIYNVVHGSVLK
jgi:plasmid stabilization system protein ParE